MAKQIERIVSAERVEDLIAVFGSFDENIKRIEEALACVFCIAHQDIIFHRIILYQIFRKNGSR